MTNNVENDKALSVCSYCIKKFTEGEGQLTISCHVEGVKIQFCSFSHFVRYYHKSVLEDIGEYMKELIK